jgi:ribosomal-protein-serine acetyltransferase
VQERDLVILVDDELELRLLVEEHAEPVYAAVDANREHLRRFLPFPDTSESPDDTLEFINSSLEGWDKGTCAQMGVWYRDRAVGCLGTVSITRAHDAAEIGYWLVADLQGRGIMTRSCQAFIDYLFDQRGIHRIVIRTDPDNVRSRALAERLGFTYEGLQREACKVREGYHDLQQYAMLVHQWNSSR